VILELVQKVLADENSGEPLDKLAFGIVGDLADAFPNGEIKQLLLAEWIASSLVLRKGYDKETKTTVKWAREVRRVFLSCSGMCMLNLPICRWSSAQPHKGLALFGPHEFPHVLTFFSSFLFLFFSCLPLTLVDVIPTISLSSRYICQFSHSFFFLFLFHATLSSQSLAI
jgi:hypothetical protein